MFTSHRLLLKSASVVRVLAFLVVFLLGAQISFAQSDVSLSKSSSSSTSTVGSLVSFTLNVVNEGTTTLTNVVVHDPLPANTSFVSASGAATYNSATEEWTIASLSPGAFSSNDLIATITGEGIIYSLAEVTAMDQVDDDSTPANTDYNEDDIASSCVSVPVVICPANSESIDASVPVGGLTNIQWFRDTGSGPVAFGTGSPINITQEGTYTFTADNSQGCSAGNCCPLIVEEACFDLALNKTAANPGPYAAGADVTYTINIFNQGDFDAYNITIADYIPTGFTFNPALPLNAGWSLTGSTATLTSAGVLAAGATRQETIVLTIDPTFQGTALINTAEIVSADDDTNNSNTPPTDLDSTPDMILGNDAGGAEGSAADDAVNGDGTGAPNDTSAATDEDDSDPAEISVTQTFDLALTKTQVGGTVIPGADNEFTITIYNQGTLDAYNIEISDYVPTGLTSVSYTHLTLPTKA